MKMLFDGQGARYHVDEDVIFDHSGRAILYINEDTIFDMNGGTPRYYFHEDRWYAYDRQSVLYATEVGSFEPEPPPNEIEIERLLQRRPRP
jgi:hypothetical protein